MPKSQDEPVADRRVVGSKSVDVVVYLLVLALALVLGWDSHRVGASWASDGPEVGYFPFYISIITGVASLYGLVSALIAAAAKDEAFVTRDQLGRVLTVLGPIIVYCVMIQFLGLYVSSFLLVGGFMAIIGRIRVWVSVLTALLFSLAMFMTFEIAFHVIMPKGPLEAALGY